MASIKCKMCGGTIEILGEQTHGECDSCGMTITFPNLSDERKEQLYNRAEHFRQSNDFDKAVAAYEQILNEDDSDPEAYWGIVLSRFGIEYVEDPQSHERIPTCHRVQHESILSDRDYLQALDHADGYEKELYEKEAKRIAEIQKHILQISEQEEPYDVFICYKETTSGGIRTKDSSIAQDIYYQLTNDGYKVFFSRITLEGKLGEAYEPYIFAALNSAKVMLVVGTKPEHFNATWVKNEWSRFLALMQGDRSKMLIPCYRDMNPYDIPDALSLLQSQDMSKIGFLQDLLHGVQKVVKKDESVTQATPEAIATASSRTNVEKLIKRVEMFMLSGDWNEAKIYCERVLDEDPENVRAYVYKAMVTLRVTTEEQLTCAEIPLSSLKDFSIALCLAKGERQAHLKELLKAQQDYRLDCVRAEIEVASTWQEHIELENKCTAILGKYGADEASQLAEEVHGIAVGLFRAKYNPQIEFIRSWKEGALLRNTLNELYENYGFDEALAFAYKALERGAEQQLAIYESNPDSKLKDIELFVAGMKRCSVTPELAQTLEQTQALLTQRVYQEGIEAYNRKDFEAAILLFSRIATSSNAQQQIDLCKKAIAQQKKKIFKIKVGVVTLVALAILGWVQWNKYSEWKQKVDSQVATAQRLAGEAEQAKPVDAVEAWKKAKSAAQIVLMLDKDNSDALVIVDKMKSDLHDNINQLADEAEQASIDRVTEAWKNARESAEAVLAFDVGNTDMRAIVNKSKTEPVRILLGYARQLASAAEQAPSEEAVEAWGKAHKAARDVLALSRYNADARKIVSQSKMKSIPYLLEQARQYARDAEFPLDDKAGENFAAAFGAVQSVLKWDSANATALALLAKLNQLTRYLVIDVGEGESALRYPVLRLFDVPTGGWTDKYKTTKIVLRRIEPGTFMMGSPEDELGRVDNETQHQVTLTEGFWMGVFEVTQRQWELVMGSNPSSYVGDARPVECVSYNAIRGGRYGSQWPANSSVESTSFMGKLRAKTGLDVDLPTEAQWEYACRAGTTTALNSGMNLTSMTGRCANLNEVARYDVNGNGIGKRHAEVGRYAPNAWGLYDMHGNVWEWCKDWYGSYDNLAVTNPKGDTTGFYRVLRGGSWNSHAQLCRLAIRLFDLQTRDYSNSGLRLFAPQGR